MTALVYVAAALAEIAGCFAFWAWLRLSRSVVWVLPGSASLLLFADLLTLVDTDHAGRAYAAYGGIYIVTALCWLWFAERVPPEPRRRLAGCVSRHLASETTWLQSLAASNGAAYAPAAMFQFRLKAGHLHFIFGDAMRGRAAPAREVARQ